MTPVSSFEVEPVRATRTFEAAIEHLIEAVERAGLQTGERLPNEGVLAAQLGISKPTLRQALRVLELSGLVHVRRGKTGGIFVALGFAALVFLATQVGNLTGLNSAQTYVVEAQFDNIGGLKVRAPVRSAGVLVGRVAAIRFDTESYRAAVSLEIDSRFEFPSDSSAAILTSGLLGEQYVGLDPGADVEKLRNGDRMMLTQSAVVLEKLIGQFLFDRAAETPAPAH